MTLKYKLTVFQIHHIKRKQNPLLKVQQPHMFHIVWYIEVIDFKLSSDYHKHVHILGTYPQLYFPIFIDKLPHSCNAPVHKV
jgi:hypothetical protein